MKAVRVRGGHPRLDRDALLRGVARLSRTDSDLAGVAHRHGPPPMWCRRPGFPTLVRIILEQQVSLASADAAFARLREAVPRLTPHRFLELDGRRLKRIGFSRQKTAYCRDLADRVRSGSLKLGALEGLDDAAVGEALGEVKGIGPWTIAIYLLMALRRIDVWPDGDIALASAAQQVKGLSARPSDDDLRDLSAAWRPWRSVAARMLWHNYLQERRR